MVLLTREERSPRAHKALEAVMAFEVVADRVLLLELGEEFKRILSPKH